ncbi:BatA domain-containing protein [Engelhardtia mirabilis]|uniref:Aerotolerance regulator N-terminal domain-containing protein n=1 Tax=Engelhardtia mirabilis TaxID=2528011 RepID=A0A518BMM0_9BACT|nr:hypothetical protein Pla133_33240 [Planctomycetes bacterium Pla133]QDV02555.1 hypothetical protein Pla86_33230 [Planctomycetes bacterium Pla86]
MIGGFVHPALALGALLAAVPLIIHLLNRRRHRPLEWGAMRFVLAAYKRTRRRAQLENLLLLLLRMLGVALLALALARPFAGDASPLAPLTESRRDVVIVLDVSASTGYRDGAGTVHARIIERARELLGDLDGGRGDRARLVVADDRPRLLSWRTPSEALNLLGALDQPSDTSMDLVAALAEVLASLQEDGNALEASEVEVRLLTDLQRSNFDPDPSRAEGQTDELVRALDRLVELELVLTVEDLGPAELIPPNVGVTDIAPISPVLGPGLPVDIAVDVTNHGASAVGGVRLALAIDGERLPSRVLDMVGGATAREIFAVTFDEPGAHVLEASIEADPLAFDDRRAAVIDVPGTVSVLLVNGAPDESAIELDEVGLFAAALAPPDDGGLGSRGFVPFSIEEIDPAFLDAADLDLAPFDAIVLANVEAISARAVERLTERVSAGAGLIVSLGDRTVPSVYARRLFAADGTGLLPAEPLEVVSVADRRDGYYRVGEFDGEHPALAFFNDPRWRPLLTEIPIYTFIATTPLPQARVLAALDAGKAPLLVERAFGAGRVLLFTTSLDVAWTRIPESPRTLVPFAHELVRHAGRGPARRLEVPVGEPLSVIVDRFPRSPVAILPDGARRPVDGEPTELPGGRWQLPPITETGRLGVYRVTFDEADPVVFAVQGRADEGDLERLPAEALAELHPALRAVRAESADVGEQDVSRRGELWRGLLWICLAVLISESLWGAWLERRRRLS